MKRRVDAGFLLFLTPLVWGLSFPAGKLALERMPPLAFMAWTRGLGLVFILGAIPVMRRAERGPSRPVRAVLWPGILLGGVIFVAYVLQTEGLARTTATNAGFITGLYVVFTPLLAAAGLRHRAAWPAWAAVGISVAGLALLSVPDLGAIRVHAGDALVLAGAAAWAGHIVAVGHYSPRFPAWMLSAAQAAGTLAFQLVAAVGTGLRPSVALSGSVLPLLLVTGVLGSGLGYTLQVMAQRTVTAVRAVVLLAGESLFAALFAAVWIGERLRPHQWAGAALVLGAMAFSELAARRPPGTHLEPASAP